MYIQILASSSAGNCYALNCRGEVLLLEAGIPLARVRTRLHVGLSCVIGCLISHEHQDHAGFVRQYWEKGIEVLAKPDTLDIIKYGMALPQDYQYCGWFIHTFKTQHDAEDPAGFLIEAPDGSRVVFAIDTYLLPYKFENVNYWMLECNYDLPILQQNIDAGAVDPAQAKRLLQSHMSVDHVCAFLRAQDLSRTQAVYLLHGSARNLKKYEAKDRVRSLVGVPVFWRT